MPHGYFDNQGVELLAAFQRRAELDRRKELLAAFPADAISFRVKSSWRLTANRIYRNWIRYIAGQTDRESSASDVMAAG